MIPATNQPKQTLADLPGPTGLPILGNWLQLDLKQLRRVLGQWCEEFGPLYTFKIAQRSVVAIANPELVNQVLRDRPQTYRRINAMETVLKEIGINGVFSAEGENWQKQRPLVTQALNNNHVRPFFNTLLQITQRLERLWLRAAATHQTVDVQKDLMRYTVDVTTNLVFGYDMNTLEQTGNILGDRVSLLLSRRDLAASDRCHFGSGSDTVESRLAEF